MSQTPRTSIEEYWRLDGAAGDIPLDYLPTTTRAPVRGESMDIEAIVSGYSDPVDDPDAEEWPGWQDRYYAMLDAYAFGAGDVVVHDLASGGVAYTETHSGESVLVALRPPGDVPSREGSWALIDGIENKTMLRGRAVLSLSLVHLAPLDVYTDIESVRDALEAPI